MDRKLQFPSPLGGGRERRTPRAPALSPSPLGGCRGRRNPRALPLVLRGADANLAWVGGALRTASREGSVASLASLGIVFPTPPVRPPALPAWLIRSFHLDLVEYRREGRVAETELARLPTSKGLPSTRRCSGRGRGGRPPVPRGTGVGPSLPGQEAGRWSCHRRFERPHTRRIRRRRATGSRRPDCPRRVGVANQSDTHSRVVPTGRGSRATLAKARLATVAWGSRSTRPGSLYRQTSR